MTQPNPVSSDAAQLSNLTQAATRDAAELLRCELALAKDELRDDAKRAGFAALGLAAGAMLLVLALGLLALGVVLAFGASAAAAFWLCLVYAAAGIGATVYALLHLPRPLSETKRRLADDVHEIVEATK